MSNTLKISPAAQVLFFVSGAWLILSGISEMATTSQGNKYGSWFEETSLIALNRRGQGSLKIGLGIGLLGVGNLPVSSSSSSRTSSTSEASISTGSVATKGSDGTKIGDYDACVSIYLEASGQGEPDYEKTERDDKTLTLVNRSGLPLAKFRKAALGNWSLNALFR